MRASDVFKPGTFPTFTYVSRKAENSLSYEQRLEEALDTPGFLTSIVGSSKSGKTVLCEKVIGADRIILLTGADFRSGLDFWDVVARKLGLPLEIAFTESAGDQAQGSINATTGVRAIFHGSVNAGSSVTSTFGESTTSRQATFKDLVINKFLSQDLVLVLDDFHYVPTEMRMQIAYQLKDAIRQELKAVIVSLPHRADDAIRENPDLNGRMSFINIEPWSISELEEIPAKGFFELRVQIPRADITRIASESLTSPQLAQNICLNLARVIGVDDSQVVNFESKHLLNAFHRTTLNTSYADVVQVISTGPPTRGQRRMQYTVGDKRIDVYGLILTAITIDPPIISISGEKLRERMESLIEAGQRIDRNRVSDTLKQIQALLQDRPSLYQVMEWKDDKLYILDPYFLFYLRWTQAYGG
ncbi:MAG: ATP-binding protein [Firmicutes bacterium]|nr:ATP-binding protein [Bacillota bacterium]